MRYFLLTLGTSLLLSVNAFAEEKSDTKAEAKPDPKIAQVADSLSEKHFCSGCHQLEARTVGPGWKEIAAKYKKEKDLKEITTKLVEKVKKGSMGVWGSIPMPPNAGISDDDTRKILAWVLSL